MAYFVGNPRRTVDASFTTSSSDLSSAIDLAGSQLVALVFGTSWTAGNVTFQASIDNSTFRNLYTDTGGEVAVTGGDGVVAAVSAVNAPYLGACQYIKLRSGTAALGVNQTTERTVVAVLAPL